MNFATQLIGKRQLNDTLMTFTFSKPSTLTFIPGQFVLVSFDKEFSNPHPFSISSSPLDGNLELSIRKLGTFTTNMHNATLGTPFWFKGPFGMFTLDRSKGDVVMIAGGVGITPFLSMVRTLISLKTTRQFTLIYSARTSKDLLEKESFDAIAKKAKNIKIIYILSDDANADQTYNKGMVDKSFITRTIKGITKKSFYLCGPPPMVAALKLQLAELSVKENAIFVDNWDFARKVAEVQTTESPKQ